MYRFGVKVRVTASMRSILSGYMTQSGLRVEWEEAPQGFLFIWMKEKKHPGVALENAERLFQFLTDFFGTGPDIWADLGDGSKVPLRHIALGLLAQRR